MADTANPSGAPEDSTPAPSILDFEGDEEETQATPAEAGASAEADDDGGEDEASTPPVEGDDDTPSDEPEPEKETPAERKLRLRDGREVTEAELKKAFGEREERWQEVEAAKRDLQAQMQQTQQQAQFFEQQVAFAVQVAEQNLPKPASDDLWETDPITAGQQDRWYQKKVGELQHLQQVQAQQRQQVQAQQQQHFHQYVDGQSKLLLEKAPDLRPPEKRKAFYGDLLKHATEAYGFSKDEVDKTFDHRVMLMARDAIAYRKLQAQKPKVVEKAKEAPPVVQPTRRVSSAERERSADREKLNRLRKTGSVKDADAFLSRYE